MELSVIEPESNIIKFEPDPLFSVIVPIYDIKTDTLKRCLMSLEDQDYANLEIIGVFDGENKELEDIANGFKRNKKFKFITIEHAGACAARNAGFKESKGDIVSFFNSDYVAKPGMIRMWVDALKKNRDCGFVYGGYEYASSKRWVYPAKPFDKWELEIANYIDCGFPLWRKYVVEWDVNCKSLQDWDFWLRVIKTHNVKGFYLGREYSFIAEMPRPKGLSDDSSNNWIERVNYIKKKNDIPLRDILVTSLGAKYHAKEIAKMIDADFRDDTFDKPSNYKALYMIGFYIKPNEMGLNEHARQLAIFKDKYPTAKRIVHFVGADIYWLRKFPYESLKYLSGALKMSTDEILCENKEAQDELKEYGIPAKIVPIPSYTQNWEVKPLPEKFSVGVYLVEKGNGFGQSDFDKYCYEATLSIIRGMPDIQFTGYGKGGVDLSYPNLKHYQTIERENWPNYVYENSALLRLCRHDHHAMASNEFIMAGREVITNIPALGSHLIDTSGKMELNDWDKFSEGFNAHNWPNTKRAVMKKIREIKANPLNLKRVENSDELKRLLDRNTYVERIKEMCGVNKGEKNA